MADHPRPWRWIQQLAPDKLDDYILFDAAGNMVLLDLTSFWNRYWRDHPGGSGAAAKPASTHYARAVTAAASEMEELLREETDVCVERARWQRSQSNMGDMRDWDGLQDADPEPADCGKCRPCRRAALMARIDRAKAGG